MEAGTVLADSLGILCHLPVQQIARIPLHSLDGIESTGPNAAATALAKVWIDISLVILIGDGIGAALPGTAAAALAEFCVHLWFAGRMLLHLSCSAARAHTDVLDGTTETSHLMALEMGQADENIRIHDGPANLGLLDILTILDRHLSLIRTPETIGDDDLAARRERIEAVDIGTIQMLQSMLATAGI